MTDVRAGESRTYGGWQPERVAFMFGLSGRRAALVAAAVLAGIIPLAEGRLAEVAVLWPVAAVLAVTAFCRFGGRTVDEWAMAAMSWAWIRSRGQHRFAGGPFAPSPPAGAPGNPGGGPDGATGAGGGHGGQVTVERLDLPGILAPIRVLRAPAAGGRDLAVIQHPYDNTWTVVARVGCPGIGLADSVRQLQRVAGWGGLLAGLCTERNLVTRVQVVQRQLPESGADLRTWHERHSVPGAPALARDVTSELLARSALVSTRREQYLAFVMDGGRARSQIRSAGGGEAGAARVLVRQVRALAHAISAADLEIQDWLSAADLAGLLRTAFDPGSGASLAMRRAAEDAASAGPGTGDGAGPRAASAGPRLRSAGPVYAEARPGRYLHDGAVSVTYWVQEWPRTGVYPTVLGPLLADGSHRRAFGLTFEPLGPRQAERAVMRERTARHVALSLRQRTGQLVPEHERAASARALEQDIERAAGHGLVRLTGCVTVTVPDAGPSADAAVQDACTAFESDAAAARLEVHRMWFAQDSGFGMTLPLGLGLPQRRW